MIYLAANNTNVRKYAARGMAMGWMISPGGWKRPRGLVFALDNGLFRPPDAPPAGMKALPPFYRFVDHVRDSGETPLFVVAPDVPYHGDRSLPLSVKHYRHLRDHVEWPIAVAVQDGMTEAEIPAELFEWLFVGGSTEWKLKTAPAWCRFAKATGRRCHVGRVNTLHRVNWCIDIGADSADGTGIWRGDRKQLRGVLEALTQDGLWGQRAHLPAVLDGLRPPLAAHA